VASAVVTRGQVVYAAGKVEILRRLAAEPRARPARAQPPAQERFARALGFLSRRQQVDLWWRRTVRWRVGALRPLWRIGPVAPASGRPEASTKLELMMTLLERAPDQATAPPGWPSNLDASEVDELVEHVVAAEIGATS
jgi:hypothetical protein